MQKPRLKMRLGDLLVHEGIVSDAQLQQALAQQQKTGRKLGATLTELQFLTEQQLLQFLAQQLNVPFLDIAQKRIDPKAVALLPEVQARRFRALVLEDHGSRVLLGMSDPADLAAMQRNAERLPGMMWGGVSIDVLADGEDPVDLRQRTLALAGQLDIFHANAGLYVGGDLVDADPDAIDRMLNLNVNVVMKNVHNVLPHMIERGTGDIIVTSSLAAHFPTPWEPVYASSKWAVNCFVQTVRRQVFKHGIRVGSISPGPVITSLLADWPAEKLAEAKASGSLIEASEVADVVLFMLTRPRGMTIRDVVMMPTNFDL